MTQPRLRRPQGLGQSLWDFVGIPFRLVLFDQDWLPRCGWTTLEEERFRAVLPHLRGRLLDVGAGRNNLVRAYGDGIGIDVHDWGGGVQLVANSADLPFAAASFDTVSFVASLNHIPNRESALREARRVLRPDGRLLITMIGPLLGAVGHALWWYDEHRQRGGMARGEVGGLTPREVIRMAHEAGFVLSLHRRFVYAMNHLFLFTLRPSPDRPAAVPPGNHGPGC